METIHTAKRVDNQLIVITHLSQLLNYITGFGGLVVPLIIWLTQKDKVAEMDIHGKQIINFQISIILYVIIGIPAILLLGVGILIIMFAAFIGFVLPIVNAIRASRGEAPSYFGTFQIIK